MVCLTITGAMKSTPTAAIEMLLNLTPLDLLIMAEARMTLYRLHILMQLADSTIAAGMLSIWKNMRNYTLDMRSDHTIPVYTSPKSTWSLVTWTIGEIKTQSSLKMH